MSDDTAEANIILRVAIDGARLEPKHVEGALAAVEQLRLYAKTRIDAEAARTRPKNG